jgi:hypothetical protein
MSNRLMLLAFVSLASCSQPAQYGMLTVEETLGAVFIGGADGVAAAKAANPAAKPTLYQILDKPQMKEHQKRIYLIIGNIGDKNDAATLEKHLNNNFGGVLSTPEVAAIDGILSALSTMASRGVVEASAILKRMAAPEYWQMTKIQLALQHPLGVTNELAIWSFRAYARTGSPDWEVELQSLNSKLGALKHLPEAKSRLDSAGVSKEIEYLRKVKTKPISPQMRNLLPKLFNGDMENPGPATEIK